jgi:hypothetical protein
MLTAFAKNEIERFNAFAQSNIDQLTELFSEVETVGDTVKIANDLDFTFTEDDVKQYIVDNSDNILSEEQLHAVAGGGFTYAYTSVATQVYIIAWAAVFAAAYVGIVAVVL